MRLFIGASSAENIKGEYIEDCTKLLEVLLKNNDLVFGAYDKGLMGVSYNIAKKNNRKITGICPVFYKESLEAIDCDVEELTTTMLDSTLKIYKDSDAIILLPGGFGSIYEFFTANYSKICKEINIPIILYNSCGYYDKLLEFIDEICNNNFVREQERGNYIVANNIDEVVNYLKNYGSD